MLKDSKEPISATIGVYAEKLQNELTANEEWCSEELEDTTETQNRLEEFRQKLNTLVKNMEKENERWSAMLSNLKSDRLTQENKTYRQFIGKTNFLQLVVRARMEIDTISVRTQRGTQVKPDFERTQT